MNRRYLIRLLALGCLVFAAASWADNPQVKLETDLGTITVELYPKEAPKTVENFILYVEDNFYNGTLFHRVIPGFMIQAGGYTFDFVEKKTRAPIVNEASSGLKNTRGTIAMARTPDPDSASAQFFINLENNTNLDYTEANPGYAVFGEVVDGMEIVDEIAAQPRGRYISFPDAPNELIRIINAEIVE